MANPTPGTVDGGYRFKGGDPADQANWEPALKVGEVDSGYKYIGGDPADQASWSPVEAGKPQPNPIPDMTVGSVLRDVTSGLLQIGPEFVGGAANLAQMVTGNRIGKDTADAMERGKQEIRNVIGSERAAAQRAKFEADMANDNVSIADALANNKGALTDQILPTIGSMILPVGVAGAAGKLATVGKVAQGLDKAALTARVASIQQAAGIGATAAQNAASTFTELLDKGVSMEDAYKGAGITVPFSLIAGKLTGGGAETAITKSLFGNGAAQAVKAGVKETAKASFKEGSQEVGEQVGQIVGEGVGTGVAPSATNIGKQVAVAGVLGGIVGGGANVVTSVGQQPAAAPRVEDQPKTPQAPAPTTAQQILAAEGEPAAPNTQPAQPGTTGEGAGVSQPTQVAPTTVYGAGTAPQIAQSSAVMPQVSDPVSRLRAELEAIKSKGTSSESQADQAVQTQPTAQAKAASYVPAIPQVGQAEGLVQKAKDTAAKYRDLGNEQMYPAHVLDAIEKNPQAGAELVGAVRQEKARRQELIRSTALAAQKGASAVGNQWQQRAPSKAPEAVSPAVADVGSQYQAMPKQADSAPASALQSQMDGPPIIPKEDWMFQMPYSLAQITAKRTGGEIARIATPSGGLVYTVVPASKIPKSASFGATALSDNTPAASTQSAPIGVTPQVNQPTQVKFNLPMAQDTAPVAAAQQGAQNAKQKQKAAKAEVLSGKGGSPAHTPVNDDVKSIGMPSKMDKKAINGIMPFNIIGNKSHLLSDSIGGLIEVAARTSKRVIDAFGGAGTYTHYLRANGIAHDGDILNEYDAMRASAHRQIGKNPEAVIAAAEKFAKDLHAKAVELGIKEGEIFTNTTDAGRKAIGEFIRDRLKIHSDGDPEAGSTSVKMKDSPELAGMYLVLQRRSVNSLPVQAELSKKSGKFVIPGFTFVGADGGEKSDAGVKIGGKVKLFKPESIINSIKSMIQSGAADRMAGVDVRTGDGWQLIASTAGDGDFATVDTSYLNKTDLETGNQTATANYSKDTEEDADPETYKGKVEKYLLPAWDRGAKLLITNNWDDDVASYLTSLGFDVRKEYRKGAKSNERTTGAAELIAINFEPGTGRLTVRANSMAAKPGRSVERGVAREDQQRGRTDADTNPNGAVAANTQGQGAAVPRLGGRGLKPSRAPSAPRNLDQDITLEIPVEGGKTAKLTVNAKSYIADLDAREDALKMVKECFA